MVSEGSFIGFGSKDSGSMVRQNIMVVGEGGRDNLPPGEQEAQREREREKVA
jgi:hypothetical protein